MGSVVCTDGHGAELEAGGAEGAALNSGCRLDMARALCCTAPPDADLLVRVISKCSLPLLVGSKAVEGV